MRLRSIHPKYLDTKGLLAVWREGLLAKHVLEGKTKGYLNHPQLIRFKASKYPIKYMYTYLRYIWAEANSRGFHFDATKCKRYTLPQLLTITQGQLAYERAHLQKKLSIRSPQLFATNQKMHQVLTHPLFMTIPGPIADWEKY